MQHDPVPILSDAAIQTNFQRQLEENRRLRRWVNLLMRVLRDGGATIPAELQAEFDKAELESR